MTLTASFTAVCDALAIIYATTAIAFASARLFPLMFKLIWCGRNRTDVALFISAESFEAERVLGAPDERSHVYGNNDLRFKMLNEMSGSKLRIYHGIQDSKFTTIESIS